MREFSKRWWHLNELHTLDLTLLMVSLLILQISYRLAKKNFYQLALKWIVMCCGSFRVALANLPLTTSFWTINLWCIYGHYANYTHQHLIFNDRFVHHLQRVYHQCAHSNWLICTINAHLTTKARLCGFFFIYVCIRIRCAN